MTVGMRMREGVRNKVHTREAIGEETYLIGDDGSAPPSPSTDGTPPGPASAVEREKQKRVRGR
jgi:hypothetical protein